MDTMLRRALREYNGLRHQLDKHLLGEDGDAWVAQLKKFLRKEPCWGKTVAVDQLGVPVAHPDSLLHLCDLWITFWQEVGGRALVDTDLGLPKYRPGFIWPIVTPRDLGAQALYGLMISTKFFPCLMKWPDIAVLEVKEDYLKVVDQAPVVLIQSSVEPDTRLSYNQAVAGGLHFISLRQRIILELFGFWLNKFHRSLAMTNGIPTHLDREGRTYTSTLGPEGGVVNAYWDGANGGFVVNWSRRDKDDSDGGVRQAVS